MCARRQGTNGEPGRAVRGAGPRDATAEDKGGYAKAMGEEFYARQRELLARSWPSTTS